MRFMMLLIPNFPEERDWTPTAEEMATMAKYNQTLAQAGVLLALDGLHSDKEGARVSFESDRPAVTDGPFTEAKELVGGYWIIQVSFKEEAVEWASRCPAHRGAVIEVRRMYDMGDFPDDVLEAAGLLPPPSAE
jgi:hypothetical protein